MTGSNGRWRGSLWWGAAALGVLAASAPGAAPRTALAQTAQAATPPAAGPTVRVRVAESPAHLREIRAAMAGMVAAIDPATGELRAPTAEEHQALTGSAAAQRLAAPRPIEVPGGGLLLQTSPANVDFLTAVRGEDGGVRYRCTHGLDAASRTFVRDHQSAAPEVLR